DEDGGRHARGAGRRVADRRRRRAERARPRPDHDPLRWLDPEAARVRNRRAGPPRASAGHHLQPGRAARRAGAARRGRMEHGRRALAAYPGEAHTSEVRFIYPLLDASNRTLRVRLEFKNRSDRNGPRLRPGMYGNVTLSLPETAGLTVPAEAVVDTGETHYLF